MNDALAFPVNANRERKIAKIGSENPKISNFFHETRKSFLKSKNVSRCGGVRDREQKFAPDIFGVRGVRTARGLGFRVRGSLRSYLWRVELDVGLFFWFLMVFKGFQRFLMVFDGFFWFLMFFYG